jgi:hypothetical protein
MNDLRVQVRDNGDQVPCRLISIRAGEEVCDDKNMRSSLPGRFGRFVAASLVMGALFAVTSPINAYADATVAGETARVSTNSVSTDVIAAAAAKELEAKWGVQISALRISAAGNVIDFRYRVTDAVKASALGNPGSKPELRDRATGKSLHVPNTKVGQMRSTGQRLAAGRTYTALFTNPGKVVKPGNKVDIVIGDFRAEDLTVGE